jgi:hypothetical protein
MSICPEIPRFRQCVLALAISSFLVAPEVLLRGQERAPLLRFLPGDSLTIRVTPAIRDSLIRLPHEFIAAGSDTFLTGTRVLKRGEDYSISYRSGTITFSKSLFAVQSSDSSFLVQIRYLYFPFRFQESYYHRKLVVLKDSTGADSLRIARPKGSFEIEDIFGPNLQKSGSIVRGFTVGSNRDFSLNSGLRLQLAGKIASDIEVAASLTDENTPIQPEGTTQTLQEFDKVFVEIKSTSLSAILGDFNLDLGGSEFGRISRKLQGAEGTAEYRTGNMAGSVVISGAVTRGKFNTNQFNGQEGVQGPYRLVGRNGEREIIVIAGTERVYINGDRQVRGEINDYTIDYSTGEVTFTTKRLITAASRIVIDFEYTDRQFSRSLFAAQSVSNLFDNKARFAVTYLREADDPDAPIDFSISDSARTILQNAGSNREKAVMSGVTRVDTNGYYVRVDTLLGGATPVTFYRYSPGDPNAKYNVTFSFVGVGKGDYIRQQIGVFLWKGPGAGDYLPLKYLPFPELHQVIDVAIDAAPTSALALSGEYAGSLFDANRFSTLDDASSTGHALKFAAGFAPRDVTIGGTRIGSFDMKLNERFTKSTFVPADRANDIEFNRKWGIDTLTASDEEIREASLGYMPAKGVSISGGYGHIDRGNALTSTRLDGSVSVKRDGMPLTEYYIEHVQSDESIADNVSDWLRQKGSIEYTLWNLTPFVRYEGEHREISSRSTQVLKAGSLRYDDVASGLRFKQGGDLSLTAEYGWRTDDAFDSVAVVRQAQSFTQAYGGRLSAWGDFTTSLDVTLRKKTFSQEFKRLGNADIQTVLVRSQSRYTPFNRGLETDLFYEVSTEEAAKLQRVFVRVAQGTGNYQYLGDLNGNGLADENEFVPARFDGDYIVTTVPTEQLFPIIDLKTSVRLRLTPGRMFTGRETFLENALSVLSTETYARVDEKSSMQDLKQIYLLHFSKFQQDSTTIAGSNLFTQDLFLFEGRPDFSARFRFSERRGTNSYSAGLERSYARERSVRLRWQLVQEISNQIDYANKNDRLGTQFISSRTRDILSNDLIFDLSYRPDQNVEFGFKFEVSRSIDRFQTPELPADLNTEGIRLVYAFQGAGQARAELSREEIVLGGSSEILPYELTGGRVPGKTWIWRLAIDYRITNFIQATANYDGRSEGGRPPVHTARAEVRAFF